MVKRISYKGLNVLIYKDCLLISKEKDSRKLDERYEQAVPKRENRNTSKYMGKRF